MASRNTISRNTAAYTYNGTEWVCPSCGSINNGTAKFCTKCGAHRLSSYDINPSVGGYGAMPNTQEAYGVQVAEVPKKKSGAGKAISIILISLLLLGGIGFAAWHFLISDLLGNNDNQTEVAQENQTAQSDEANPNAADNSNANQATENKDSATDPNYNPNAADPNEKVVDESEENSKFKKGETYTVVDPDGVRVRREPKKVDGNELKYYELDSNLKPQAMTESGDNGIACLKKGSKVTCIKMEGDWMKVGEDAWVCTFYGGETLIR
jgi:hypothetical protein